MLCFAANALYIVSLVCTTRLSGPHRHVLNKPAHKPAHTFKSASCRLLDSHNVTPHVKASEKISPISSIDNVSSTLACNGYRCFRDSPSFCLLLLQTMQTRERLLCEINEDIRRSKSRMEGLKEGKFGRFGKSGEPLRGGGAAQGMGTGGGAGSHPHLEGGDGSNDVQRPERAAQLPHAICSGKGGGGKRTRETGHAACVTQAGRAFC